MSCRPCKAERMVGRCLRSLKEREKERANRSKSNRFWPDMP